MSETHALTRAEILARLAILITTLLWGSTFVAVNSTNDFFKPNFLLALRFLPAAALLCLVFFKRLKRLNKAYFKTGAVLGLIMAAGYSVQAIAITTAGGLPGRSSFLVATYCVLVPFVNIIFSKQAPNKYNIAAAFLCFAGVAVISMPDLLKEKDAGLTPGDICSLVSSIIFSFYIVLLPRLSRRLDSVLITIVQFIYAGSYALIFSLLFEDNSNTVWNSQSIFTLAYLTVLCSALCVLLQVIGQKNTPPDTAALIMSLESVFSIFLSVMLTDEVFSAGLAAGCLCIFTAIIISETKLSFFKRKTRP